MAKTQTEQHSSKKLFVVLSLLGAFLAILLKSAVYEDAYIAYRVVENYLSGYGLNWNLDERVQVFSSPLWLLLHIPFQAVFHNIYLVSLGLSSLCVAAMFIFSWKVFRRNPFLWACFFVTPFIFSRTLATYSTSGMENPLLHLLFAIFVWIFVSVKNTDRWFYLSLATALSLVARLDMIFFYAPLWLVLFMQKGTFSHIRQILLGMFPIIVWLLFSLLYYGFILPNTAYAKLFTNIVQLEYFRFGGHYLLNLFAADIFSGLLLLVSFIALLTHGRRYFVNEGGSTLYFGIAFSVWCYTFYIMLSGGTYLSGRFLSLPVFASLYLLCQMVFSKAAAGKSVNTFFGLLLVGCIAFIAHPSDGVIRYHCAACFKGVDSTYWEKKIRLVDWITGKSTLPVFGEIKRKEPVIILGSIGQTGYRTDPAVKIIDPVGLADPLLARLPVANSQIKSTGTLIREVPEGYPHAALTGDVSRMSKPLGNYYTALRRITNGPLWDKERLKTILDFNLGKYDFYLDRYTQATARQPISRRQKPSGQSIKSTTL